MTSFEHSSRTRLVFGPGSIHQAGRHARELGFRRTLIVADNGMEKAGHVATVLSALAGEGIESSPWSNFDIPGLLSAQRTQPSRGPSHQNEPLRCLEWVKRGATRHIGFLGRRAVWKRVLIEG